MNKESKKNIAIFVILIILIVFLLIYNLAKNKRENNIDRKIIYINGISYNEVYNKGEDVFFGIMDLLISNGLDFEKKNNKDVIYNINNKEYKKIVNFSNVLTRLSKTEIDKYIKYNEILKKEDNYYLLKDYKINTSYIGSKIKIDNYNDNYVIFKSSNYYCDNSKYIGSIDEELKCNYKVEDSTFKLVFLENNLVIDNLDSILKIIK